MGQIQKKKKKQNNECWGYSDLLIIGTISFFFFGDTPLMVVPNPVNGEGSLSGLSVQPTLDWVRQVFSLFGWAGLLF